jgi:predicted CopG family antitoxin
MDYIKTLTKLKNISQSRLDLINRLIEKKVDYRALINVRDNFSEIFAKDTD